MRVRPMPNGAASCAQSPDRPCPFAARLTAPLYVFLTVLILVASMTAAFAGPVRKGAVMQVKPNSIWFDESARLTHWQELKKSGNAAAMTSYEQQMQGQRTPGNSSS